MSDCRLEANATLLTIVSIRKQARSARPVKHLAYSLQCSELQFRLRRQVPVRPKLREAQIGQKQRDDNFACSHSDFSSYPWRPTAVAQISVQRPVCIDNSVCAIEASAGIRARTPGDPPGQLLAPVSPQGLGPELLGVVVPVGLIHGGRKCREGEPMVLAMDAGHGLRSIP